MVSLSLVKVAPVSGFDSVAFSSASMQMSSTIKELFVSKTSKDPCADMYEVISSMVLCCCRNLMVVEPTGLQLLISFQGYQRTKERTSIVW